MAETKENVEIDEAKIISEEEYTKLVGLKMDNELFGIDILKIREIIRMEQITRVPKAPYYIEGIIDMRGNIIPVVNLRKRFDLDSESENKEEDKIIVVENNDKEIGVIVDNVTEVILLPNENIEPPPATIGGIESEYITGVGKMDDMIIILLDISKTLKQKDKEE